MATFTFETASPDLAAAELARITAEQAANEQTLTELIAKAGAIAEELKTLESRLNAAEGDVWIARKRRYLLEGRKNRLQHIVDGLCRAEIGDGDRFRPSSHLCPREGCGRHPLQAARRALREERILAGS